MSVDRVGVRVRVRGTRNVPSEVAWLRLGLLRVGFIRVGSLGLGQLGPGLGSGL